MATHDYIISNASGAAVRADLNNALAAIASNNSSATEPTTTYAYQWWADTGSSPTVMKLRNAANSAWITLFQLDGEWSLIPFENGTAAAPSIYFKDSGTDTGIFSPGTDQVGISAGGTSRFEISTSATTSTLPVVHPLGAVATPSITFTGDLNTGIWSPAADTIAFSEGGTEAMRIDSSGRLGIGTTPDSKLHVTDAIGNGLRIGYDSGVTNKNIYDANEHLFRDVNGNSSVTIDSSKRLLVGTSSALGTNNSITIKGTAASNPSIYFGRNANASSIVADNVLGFLEFGSGDGGLGAEIKAVADGTWSSTSDCPSRLVFSVTADGASSPTERMKITNEGYLKATTTGGYLASAGVYHELRVSSTNYTAVVTNIGSTSPNGIFVGYTTDMNNTGNPFIQCGAGASYGTVRAEIRSNGGLANYQANNVNLSDINTKKDITPATGTWDCIKEWEIVNYRYKDQPDDADLNLGVIAQQVAESCPEVITIFSEAKDAKPAVLADDGNEVEPAQDAQPEKLGVKEQQMYWMAIKALQEAQVRIEQLEAKVAALESA